MASPDQRSGTFKKVDKRCVEYPKINYAGTETSEGTMRNTNGYKNDDTVTFTANLVPHKYFRLVSLISCSMHSHYENQSAIHSANRPNRRSFNMISQLSD